jgi:autotransporter-associated beta strand protein
VQATSGAYVSTASVTISGQAQWNSSANASWNTAGSWADSISAATIAAPGTRGIAGDTVLFAAATGAIAGLDGANPILAAITFNNGATSYTIAQGSGGNLTLQAAGGANVSTVLGNHAITAPLVLASNTNFNESASTRLTIGGNTSGGGSLTKSGAGIVELSGANNFTGGTIVQAGKLLVDNPNSLPDGGSLTIGVSSYFSAPTVASSAAVMAAPPASPATSAAAVVNPPPPVVSSSSGKASQQPPEIFAKGAAARATVLSQMGAPPPARAAAWPFAAATHGAISSGPDADADRSARIRDAIFLHYARD